MTARFAATPNATTLTSRGIRCDSGQSAPTRAISPDERAASDDGQQPWMRSGKKHDGHDGRNRRQRNQPAAHFVADQHPGEYAVPHRVHHRSNLEKRLHAARDRAHLPRVLAAQRVSARHVRDRVVHRYGAESVRARGQRRGEVTAQVRLYGDAVQVGANGVAASGGAYDAARARLQSPEAHLVLDVPGLDGIGGRVAGCHTDVPSRSDTDRGIGESGGQAPNGARVEPDRGVRVDDDVAANHLAGRVLERCFSAPNRHAEQLDPPVRVPSNDCVRLIGRGIRDHQYLPPVSRVVLSQQCLDGAGDLSSFIVCRNDHRHGGPPAGVRGGLVADPARVGDDPKQRRIERGSCIGGERSAAVRRLTRFDSSAWWVGRLRDCGLQVQLERHPICGKVIGRLDRGTIRCLSIRSSSIA